MKVLVIENSLDDLLNVKISVNGGQSYTDYNVSSLKNGGLTLDCNPSDLKVICDTNILNYIKVFADGEKLNTGSGGEGGLDTYLKFNAGTPDGNADFWSKYASIILEKTAFTSAVELSKLGTYYGIGVFVRSQSNAFTVSAFDTSAFTAITYAENSFMLTAVIGDVESHCTFTIDSATSRGAMLLNYRITKNGDYQAGEGRLSANKSDGFYKINVAIDFSGLGAIWGGNSSTANVGDKITLSIVMSDISDIYVGVQGGGYDLESAKLSDVINAGAAGVELPVTAGPGYATVKVTATSSGTTRAITFTVTSADTYGIVTHFSAFAWK